MLTESMTNLTKHELRVKAWFERARGVSLGRFTQLSFKTRRWAGLHASKIEIGVWLLAFAAVALLANPIQTTLSSLVGPNEFEKLQNVVIAIGAAMIGATAIVASFILFAMQVNVERLPYSLFSRFSSDRKLLSTFGSAFLLAIGGTSLSLITSREYMALVILLGLGIVALILRLLLQAYRRSLTLINPISQLTLLARDVSGEMRRWDRRLRWILPLLPEAEAKKDGLDDHHRGPSIDARRAAILEMNKGWDGNLRTAISQAVAFSRQAAERGDLEVSAAALNTVIRLNQSYVHVKGRTFQANNLLIDNPAVTDGTINGTLEDLRRLQRIAVSRSDEQHLEQLFRTYLALAAIYLHIEYPGRMPSHSHALLATGYLESAVEAALPTAMTDTVMAGTNVLADAGKLFIQSGNSTEAAGIIQKIGAIGAAGVIKGTSLPITLTAIEQLAQIQLSLFYVEKGDSSYATRQIREAVTSIARMVLTLPDTPLRSSHSTYLGPFFSGASFHSFRTSLTALANLINQAEPDNEVAKSVARNIENWADQLFLDIRELLQLSIEKRSHFTFDMIHWITGMSEILITIAKAPATDGHISDQLTKHADWLFCSLTYIPRDKETVQWIENFSFTEDLFRFAMMAVGRGWSDGFGRAWDLLVRWGFEGGRVQTGWNTLENSLAALSALALHRGANLSDRLLKQVQAASTADNAPDRKTLDHTARGLRERTHDIRPSEFEINGVNRVLSQVDAVGARTLLMKIADILSPNTADEPPRIRL
jgi:hypothetical protein